MPKYDVTLIATASAVVQVEAENADEARELIWNEDLPYAPGYSGFNLDDWQFPSDANPKWSKPEDDLWEVED